MDNTDKVEAAFMGKNEEFDKMQLSFTAFNAQGKLVSVDMLYITEKQAFNEKI